MCDSHYYVLTLEIEEFRWAAVILQGAYNLQNALVGGSLN